MRTPHSYGLGLLLIATLALCLGIGCKKQSTNSEPAPTNLSVTFRNSFTIPDRSYWVVVGSPAGDSVLAVQRVLEDGTVTFTDLGTDHVTLSIAVRDENSASASRGSITTYQNAPLGAWLWGSPDYTPPDTLGRVELDLTFEPSAQNSLVLVNWPQGAAGASIESDTVSSFHVIDTVRVLEAGRMTLLATLRDANYHLLAAATLLDQPFVAHQLNPYALALNPVPARTFTASRPLNRLSVAALRGAAEPEYYGLGDSPVSVDGITSLTFPVVTMPAPRYDIGGYYQDASAGFMFSQYVSAIPTAVTVPSSAVTAEYDGVTRRFTAIAVSGEADCITAWWHNAAPYSWTVYAPVNTTSLGFPAIPDSIRARFNGLNDLQSTALSLRDFDTAHGFDDFVRIERMGDAVWSEICHQVYWYSAYFGSTAATQMSWPDSHHSPRGRRAPAGE